MDKIYRSFSSVSLLRDHFCSVNGFSGTEAAERKYTFSAPAFSRASAQASAVAPVVIRSSTSNTVRPLQQSFFAAYAPATFFRLSSAVSRF